MFQLERVRACVRTWNLWRCWEDVRGVLEHKRAGLGLGVMKTDWCEYDARTRAADNRK